MSASFTLKYYTRKALLTLLGPAQLDESSDPVAALEREREKLFGPRPAKATKVHIPKRHFASSSQNAA